MEKKVNSKQRAYENEPAFPTTPVQDKFGQVLLFFGISKLELIAAIVAAGYIQNQKNGSILYPEVIAGEALELAKNILDQGSKNRVEPGTSLTISE